jgi:predicted nucleotidyltransferase
VAVFGLRARASSTEGSGLDLAVIVEQPNRFTAAVVKQAKRLSVPAGCIAASRPGRDHEEGGNNAPQP